MKKMIFSIIVISLVLSSASVAYAKPGKGNDQKGRRQQTIQQDKDYSQSQTEIQNKGGKFRDKGDNENQMIQNDTNRKNQKKDKSNNGKAYGKKQSFKFEGSPVIKYGKYKIPIRPITKGMGAAYTYDKTTGILTVTKDTTVIVINLKDKTVTVNGVLDTTSNIFTAKNDKAKQVLRYIADRLGVKITFSKNKITTEEPEEVPTITGVTSAVYSVSGSAITISVTGSAITTSVTGAGAVNDKVDVTKISFTNTSLNQTYQLTDSVGIISSDSSITINLSQADVLGLTGYTARNTTTLLNIAAGVFSTDAAGNASSEFDSAQAIPLTIVQ